MEISRLEFAYDCLKIDPPRICDHLLGNPAELDRYGKLFRKIWKLAGKPDCLDFGKHSFFNHYGHTTNNKIRIEAIFYYIKKLYTSPVQPSSYIFNQRTTRYDKESNGQAKYIFEVQKFVKDLVRLIGSRPFSSICNDSSFFDAVLSFCGDKRAELARNARSEGLECFGVLQSRQPANPGLFTSIRGYSLEYNDKMQETLRNLYLDVPSSSSSLQLEYMFTGESLEADFEKIITQEDGNLTAEELIVRVTDPRDHHIIRLVSMFKRFMDEPDKRSHYLKSSYISASRMITLRGRSYPLSIYVTKTSSPSTVYLIHTSPLLHKRLLKEATLLFMDTLQSPKNEADLLMKMAKFQYLLAHITPFFRGSAAICEWIEMALFCHYDYKVSYPEETCMNLEALTLSLEEFIEKYPSLVNIYF